MKRTLLYIAAVLMLATIPAQMFAQKWQSSVDTLWASHRYEQKNGVYTLSSSDYRVMSGWTSTNPTIVYYWRIAPGRIRADLVYTPAYMRMPVFGIKMSRVSTGEVLYQNTINTTVYRREKTTVEAIGELNIPADEYYRVEFTVDNASYVYSVDYFLLQRENTMPTATMANMGGTGSHLFDFGSTDPLAPSGNAYDWAYVEGMVESEHQHPCDYFMTIGALNSYMGFQTNGRINNGTDFNRRVLFSVWDNGNTDEDPDLPEYMQAEVFDYNHEGVSGHGGGEGSSGTVMFQDKPEYWQPDKWVQFLLNVRSENVRITMKDKHGNDSIAEVQNTVMTAWYKMEDWPQWQYMASIRASFINELISGWYSFIENFGGNEGWGKHRVNYRHAFMRSAASGEWYNRNYVNFFPCYSSERPKSDATHGASGTMENTFYLEYGGYVVNEDSSHYTSLVTDKSCVDTIDLDRLNRRIDQALKLANRNVVNQRINQASPTYPNSDWTILFGDGVNPAHAIDEHANTYWHHENAQTHTIAFKANDKRTITAFIATSAGQRCRLVDVYTSEDGENWTLAADSIYLYNFQNSEVTLPTPVTTANLKLVFYDHVSGNYINMHNIVFKGEYDLDALLALAKEYIDNQNTFNYYADADLAQLQSVYNDGNCTDAVALAGALKQLAKDGTLLKYGKVAQKAHIAADNAYMLYDIRKRGYLATAMRDGKYELTIRGAAVDGALEKYRQSADVTDPCNSWQVLSSEKFADAYYLYNIGAKQFLSLKGGQAHLSDEAYAMNEASLGSQIYFLCNESGNPVNGQMLNIDPTKESPVFMANRTLGSYFYLYNNYNLRPENHTTLDLIDTATKPLRLKECVERAGRILNLEDGIVGSLADEQEKDAIAALYNNGDVADNDLAALEQALNEAQYVEIDSHHAYRIFTTTADGTQNCLAADYPYLLTGKEASSAAQMWTLTPEGTGYIFSSQQYGIDLQSVSNSGNVRSVSSDKSFAYRFSPVSEGQFYISQASYQPYTVNGRAATATVQRQTVDGAVWQIKPVNTYDVKLNAAGVAVMCVDFDAYIPDGAAAYVADHVDGAGVISLLRLNGVVPHATPVVLRGEPNGTVSLTVGGRNFEPYDGANILTGTFLKKQGLTKNICYTLKVSGNTAVMKTSPIASNVAENKAYILATEGMPAIDTYTFDFENILDGITPALSDKASNPTGIYDMQGRKASGDAPGIYIRNGQKVIVR